MDVRPPRKFGRDYALRRQASGLLKSQVAVAHGDPDAGSRAELAAQDALRQRVLDLLLDRALERPRAVHRVVPRLAQELERLVVEHELDVALEQAAAQV